MEGLESIVEKALQDEELPFEFIEEQQRPQLKANLAKMYSGYGEILYKHKLGRTETHRLERGTWNGTRSSLRMSSRSTAPAKLASSLHGLGVPAPHLMAWLSIL